MNTKSTLELGIDKLSAVELVEEIRDCEYAYYADETGKWYLVTAEEVEDLGERLLSGERDAYSLWCADTDSRETSDPR